MSYKQNQEKMTVSSTGKVSTASVSDDLTTTSTSNGIYRGSTFIQNDISEQTINIAANDGVSGAASIRLDCISDTNISGAATAIYMVSTPGFSNTITSNRGLIINSSTDNITFSPSSSYRIQFTNTSPYAYKSAGGVWGTLSDSRLKQSITEINGALDKILTLHPVHYQFINQGENTNPSGTRTGFIAQEFEQVLPGHTFEIEPMLEADKKLLGEGVKAKGIEADLVPYLVKAIQELKLELDTVKAELATLKG